MLNTETPGPGLAYFGYQVDAGVRHHKRIIMKSQAALTTEIIVQAEAYTGIRAGIARLEDVLNGDSYQATPESTCFRRPIAAVSRGKGGLHTLVLAGVAFIIFQHRLYFQPNLLAQ